MKIGIEGQRLFRVKKHGMDVFALELIRNLQLIDNENEYLIFVKPGPDDTVLSESKNFKIVRLKTPFYPLWEQLSLKRASEKAGCDILHCTANTAPAFIKTPLILQLHDIIYLENNFLKILSGTGTPYQKFGNIYRRLIVPALIKRSRRIITVSNMEKKRIGGFFGITDSPKLKTIYCGVSEHFKPVNDQQEISRIKEKYCLPERFFFFLGNTDPKKNTKGTLKAYADFVKARGTSIRLVIADYGKDELSHLLSELHEQSLCASIDLIGYVPNSDLPVVYNLCEIFLYPSFRESFGIPILEAMACGTPVITSKTASMPEVASDAALITDPFSPGEITNAMMRIMDDAELKSALLKKGFDQSAKFSWKSMAENLLKVYREIGSDNRNLENRGHPESNNL
jgi:glycosyltransferase involved in cell wall biosynthesis